MSHAYLPEHLRDGVTLTLTLALTLALTLTLNLALTLALALALTLTCPSILEMESRLQGRYTANHDDAPPRLPG